MMSVGRSLVDLRSPAKQGLGVTKPAPMQSDKAQPVSRFEMAKIGSKHKLVKLFRLGQSSLRVEKCSPLKGLRRAGGRVVHQRRYAHGALPPLSNSAKASNCGFSP